MESLLSGIHLMEIFANHFAQPFHYPGMRQGNVVEHLADVVGVEGEGMVIFLMMVAPAHRGMTGKKQGNGGRQVAPRGAIDVGGHKRGRN